MTNAAYQNFLLYSRERAKELIDLWVQGDEDKVVKRCVTCETRMTLVYLCQYMNDGERDDFIHKYETSFNNMEGK